MSNKGKKLVKIAKYIIVISLLAMLLASVYASVKSVRALPYAPFLLLGAIAVIALLCLPVLFHKTQPSRDSVEQAKIRLIRESARKEVERLFPSNEHILEPMDFDKSDLSDDEE